MPLRNLYAEVGSFCVNVFERKMLLIAMLHHQMTFSKGYSDQRSSAAARRRSSCVVKGRKSAEERISVVMTISWALMTFQWALITFSPEVAVRYALVYTIFVTIAL